MHFINRKQETKELLDYLNSESNAILFLYGPKSCGKSTLLKKIIQEKIDIKKFAVSYINLRSVIIYNFKTFLDIFFQNKKRFFQKVKQVIKGITINAGFFEVGLRDKLMLKKNAFKIMEDQIIKSNKKGIKPVIIIDEIQELKSIYMNGERNLLNELFNFFISLTKQNHLAHVILATSDSCFLEEIYANAKLAKTCQFYLINHLEKKDIEKWLKLEGLKNKKDIDYVWNNLGGSPWEIQQVLIDLKNKRSLKNAMERVTKDLLGRIRLFYQDRVGDKNEQNKFKKVSQEIAKKGFYQKKDNDNLRDLIKEATENDIWFFEAAENKIKANSKSIENIFKKIF